MPASAAALRRARDLLKRRGDTWVLSRFTADAGTEDSYGDPTMTETTVNVRAIRASGGGRTATTVVRAGGREMFVDVELMVAEDENVPEETGVPGGKHPEMTAPGGEVYSVAGTDQSGAPVGFQRVFLERRRDA